MDSVGREKKLDNVREISGKPPENLGKTSGKPSIFSTSPPGEKIAKFCANFIEIEQRNDEILQISLKNHEILQQKKRAKILQNFAFGAVQRCANLVELEKC